MEYLLLAVILFFILRIGGTLLSLLRGTAEPEAPSGAPEQRRWKGPSPREETGRLRGGQAFWGEVEEAKWRDLSN